MFVTPSTPGPRGLLRPGNIDLTKRRIVRNPDGTTSTVRSAGFEEDGMEVVVPTTAEDGSRILNDDEALDVYRKTGRHLGKFSSREAASKYSEQLHEDYGAGRIPGYPKPKKKFGFYGEE